MTKKLAKEDRESAISAQICQWLHEKKFLFWRANNTPVLGRGGFKMRTLPKWTPKGLPDINLIYKGQFYGIEVKSPLKGLTTDQELIQRRLLHSGAHYFVVHSLDGLKFELDNRYIPY